MCYPPVVWEYRVYKILEFHTLFELQNGHDMKEYYRKEDHCSRNFQLAIIIASNPKKTQGLNGIQINDNAIGMASHGFQSHSRLDFFSLACNCDS